MPKVKVGTKEGHVKIYDGRLPDSYTISNHEVTVANKRDLDRFLRQVGGVEVESKPDSGKAGA